MKYRIMHSSCYGYYIEQKLSWIPGWFSIDRGAYYAELKEAMDRVQLYKEQSIKPKIVWSE